MNETKVTDFLFQSTLPRRERRTSAKKGLQPLEFQSTLPRRERRAPMKRPGGNSQFQSTLPRRERLHHPAALLIARRFNPRSRVGSDSHLEPLILFILLFQSTLPRRERRIKPTSGFRHVMFQSTLPRRERQIGITGAANFKDVSIHAPA